MAVIMNAYFICLCRFVVVGYVMLIYDSSKYICDDEQLQDLPLCAHGTAHLHVSHRDGCYVDQCTRNYCQS